MAPVGKILKNLLRFRFPSAGVRWESASDYVLQVSVFSLWRYGAVAGAGVMFSITDVLCAYKSIPSLREPSSHCSGLCMINCAFSGDPDCL